MSMLTIRRSSYICSSSSRRTCFPRRKKTSAATVDTQIPLNMIVRCMFSGGLAAGEARRAPCTAKKETEQKSAMKRDDIV